MFFRPKANAGSGKSQTPVDAVKAWSEAMAAWQKAHAESARAMLAQQERIAEAMMLQGDAEKSMENAREDAALVIEAWTQAWQATLAGWQGELRADTAAMEVNPFGVTGWFSTDVATNAPSSTPAAESDRQKAAAEEPEPQAALKEAVLTKKVNVKPATAPIKGEAAKPGGTLVSKPSIKVGPTSAAPQPSPANPGEKPDDLTLISGVGPKLAGVLATAGVTHFSQIAAMSEAEAEALDDQLSLQGRVTREAWVAQARHLVNAAQKRKG
jgi:predicted flap endonuclease-1-like 5' DNA nuclease